MRRFPTILCFLLAFGLQAQPNSCSPDTLSEQGKLLNTIIEDSHSGITVKDSHNKTRYEVKRLCRETYVRVERLHKLLSDEQIEELFACDNCALKSLAFILYCKRREKKAIFDKFVDMLEDDIAFISSDCTDYARTLSYQQFCLEILKRNNRYFQPYFKLSKKEESILNRAVLNYEANYWKR